MRLNVHDQFLADYRAAECTRDCILATNVQFDGKKIVVLNISVDIGDVTCLDVGCCVGQNSSCSGFQSNEPCFCDVTCETYGDCCPDYAVCIGEA